LENDVCVVGISEDESDERISKINDMKKLLEDKKKEKDNKVDSFDIDLILKQKQELQYIINKLNVEKVELSDKMKQFKIDLDLEISGTGKIIQYLPVIFNIICTTPKMIVNIFVGLLNAVGHMDNLPSLWEFQMV